MATQTTNYSFDKPDIGGDSDIWGGFLNVNWDDIDGILFTVSGVADQGVADAATAQAAADAAQGTADAAVITADAALPKAGGTMTGQIVLATGGTGDEAITVTEANAVADAAAGLVDTDLIAHLADLANPHVVTTAQIGALPLTGGAISGALTVAGALTMNGTLAANASVKIAARDIAGDVASVGISWFGSSRIYLTMEQDLAVTFSSVQENQFIEIWIVQGVTGGDVTSWDDVTGWFGGTPPELSNVAGDIDVVIFTADNVAPAVYGQYAGRITP